VGDLKAYLWQRMSRASGLALGGQDGDGRSRSHREVVDGGVVVCRCRDGGSLFRNSKFYRGALSEFSWTSVIM
jgi:hypothetical protein